MTVHTYNCAADPKENSFQLDVTTGGYTMNPQISGTDDSACPLGTWDMNAHQTPATGIPGYNIPMEEATGRTYIEVHEPIFSEDTNHASSVGGNLAPPYSNDSGDTSDQQR